MLEKDPASLYDVDIGELNILELGKYLGEDISSFSANYRIKDTEEGSESDKEIY